MRKKEKEIFFNSMVQDVLDHLLINQLVLKFAASSKEPEHSSPYLQKFAIWIHNEIAQCDQYPHVRTL
jgi:hypothetical protein